MIDDLFSSYLESPGVFRDKNVLTSNFIPKKITHREEQIKQLASVVAPALRGYRPNNVFVFGTVGTGKTITAHFVMKELLEAAKKNKTAKIKTIYINCKMKKVADTEYRLFAQLLKEFGCNVPDTGLPTDVLYRKFFNIIDQEEQIIILVLDEIDALVNKVGDEFLYNLTRVNTDLKKAKLMIIGITNDLSFSDALDARVKSSLGEEEIIFPPYNAMQLRDILLERATMGFNDGVLEEAVINKCAAIAAQEHGDARRAIDLLRVAGEIAERNNETKITEKHVDMAEQVIDMDRVTESVKSQPKQSQAVLYAIIKSVEEKDHSLLTGDVYDAYKEICDVNGLKVLTQRRVGDLIAELDMLGIIHTKVISHGRYGRSREISLAIGGNVLNNVKKILIDRFGE